MKKLTLEEFINRSNLVHNNKYDYSISEYINSNTKIKIECTFHGYFYQLPINHIKGSGCPSCSGNRKLSLEEFVKKSNLIHKNKYDYSLVKFENNDSIINIICKIHGRFNQSVGSHMKGNGCNKCKHDNRRCNIVEFIKRSNLVHDNKYDYSLVEYITTNINVKILCKHHGIFEKTPKNHIKGQGCGKCNKELKNIKKINNNIEIIKEKEKNKIQILNDLIGNYNIKHNNKYDYSESIYVNSKTKMKIICPDHGEFKQSPATHIKHGCKICGIPIPSVISRLEKSWLDSMNILPENRQIKVLNYVVDGYDPITNTIYEFNGDFWHGNPHKYNPDDINVITKSKFGYLHEKTLLKEKELIYNGYNVISIWEYDYMKQIKTSKL